MIEYINRRLNDWADWCASGRRVVGLGYPGQTAFCRLVKVDGTATAPVLPEQCWEIEKAVHLLDARNRAVIEQFYLHAGTVESHAKALGMCRDTLYARLHKSHVCIMEYLQDGQA